MGTSATAGECLEWASWMYQEMEAVKGKGRSGYCVCVICRETGLDEPCIQSQERGQACSIRQKCQGEREAITWVNRTSLLTYPSRSFRRGWHWEPGRGDLRGTCTWGSEGLVTHWRCLITRSGKDYRVDDHFMFFLRRELLFWRQRIVGEVKYIRKRTPG